MTHRPSFPDNYEDNAFWSVSPADQIVLDGQPAPAPAPAWVIEACAGHQLTGYHTDCIHCGDTGATLAAMNKRIFIISETLLNQQDLTKEEAESLFEEQAELLNRIARAEDDAADDFADYRREAGFGKGL